MVRRQVKLGLLVLLLAWTHPVFRSAGAQTPVAPAFQAAADWLFDLYANQSVRLSMVNALRQRPPGTEGILAPTLPAMVKALERHRVQFAQAMVLPLQAHFSAQEVALLLAAVRTSPPAFDEGQRRKLFDVDAEFRRDQQVVIRAMTLDIGLMIASTLSEQGASRQ